MSRKITIEEFIKRARKVHNDKYEYPNVVYKGMHEGVKIIYYSDRKNENNIITNKQEILDLIKKG